MKKENVQAFNNNKLGVSISFMRILIVNFKKSKINKIKDKFLLYKISTFHI
jgi:hypothetical protein